MQIYHTYQSEYVVNSIVLLWSLGSQCKSPFKWYNFLIFGWGFLHLCLSVILTCGFLLCCLLYLFEHQGNSFPPLNEFIINYSFRIVLCNLTIISVCSWKILLKSAVSLSAFLFRLLYLMIQQFKAIITEDDEMQQDKWFKYKCAVLSNMLFKSYNINSWFAYIRYKKKITL